MDYNERKQFVQAANSRQLMEMIHECFDELYKLKGTRNNANFDLYLDKLKDADLTFLCSNKFYY